MRVFVVTLFGLLFFPALSHGQGDRTLSTRLTPPERVGDFRLADIKQLEGGAGGQLRYRSGSGLQLDAFLAPLPPTPDCERACDSVAVDAEVDAFPSMIPALVARGAFDSLRVLRDDTLRVEKGAAAAHGRHLTLTGSAGGKPVHFHLLVYGIGNHLVKVGAAYPPEAAGDSLVARFGREFVEATLQPAAGPATTACAGAPADAERIRITATSMLPPVGVRSRVAAVLAGLGFALDPAAKEPDTWRTLPAEGWPAGIDYGPFATGAGPGFTVEVQVVERGGSTAIAVAAQAVCEPKWGDEDPRGLELTLEMATADAVLDRLDPRARRN